MAGGGGSLPPILEGEQHQIPVKISGRKTIQERVSDCLSQFAHNGGATEGPTNAPGEGRGDVEGGNDGQGFLRKKNALSA